MNRCDNGQVTTPPISAEPAVLHVDLDAVASNAQAFQELIGDAELMAVVKANAYGLGRNEVAGRLWDDGVRWFGVSHFDEALALRRFFDSRGIPADQARIFSWLGPANDSWARMLEENIDVSVSSLEQLKQVRKAVDETRSGGEAPARIHLKVDVGMGRGGATLQDLPKLSEAVLEALEAGQATLVGLWSHLPNADDADTEVTQAHIQTFKEAHALVRSLGLEPEMAHLGATSAALWHPEAHLDMVRVGLGLYGHSPAPERTLDERATLKPAATFTSSITQVKKLEPGQTVSYGGTWEAKQPTWVGLLPVGYADGVPRFLSGVGVVHVENGSGAIPASILGRVCMDQTMINLGGGDAPAAQVGDQVVLFGDPAKGYASVEDWAEAGDTINYEIISALPSHVRRAYDPGI